MFFPDVLKFRLKLPCLLIENNLVPFLGAQFTVSDFLN